MQKQNKQSTEEDAGQGHVVSEWLWSSGKARGSTLPGIGNVMHLINWFI